MRARLPSLGNGWARRRSDWVTDALRLKVEHDSRLRAMREFIEAYEAQHGEITAAEITQAQRWARARVQRVIRDSNIL